MLGFIAMMVGEVVEVTRRDPDISPSSSSSHNNCNKDSFRNTKDSPLPDYNVVCKPVKLSEIQQFRLPSDAFFSDSSTFILHLPQIQLMGQGKAGSS